MTQNSQLKRIYLFPPHMSGAEMEFIREAIESNYIAPLGPQVDAFELEFAEKIGISHALAVSSGTAALHLALHVLGVGQGDEVIASSLTFIGSVSPIVFQGATPVFIDSDRSSWNMDPDLLAEELEACVKRGRMPKAVIPTDLYGQCADLGRILEICAPYGIPVVADSAEALGATYKARANTQAFSLMDIHGEKTVAASRGGVSMGVGDIRIVREGVLNCDRLEERHAGAGAKAAVFSFNGSKIITTSGGGILASDDEALIEQARFLSQQARDPAPHYEHSQLGYNYGMSNILAAIGRGQLRVLDDRIKAKRRIFAYYQEALGDIPGIEFMPEAPYGRSNRWLTVILIDPVRFGADREKVRLALEGKNIEARPGWKPMHMQPVFNPQITQITQIDGKEKRYKTRVIGGEVAEDLFNRGLCLPSGTAMTEEDMERVVSVIRRC